MPRLEYDVVFTINTSSVSTLKDELNDISSSGLQNASESAKGLNKTFSRTAESAEDIGDSISLSSQDMERFQKNTADASVAMQRMDDASRQAAGGTQAMSKSVNNSNQILFSFGDAMQDGAQFQHGFGAGARAVGNNLTFASEQIALANQKTGSLTGTFKSLGSAMLGPAGIVFAVNAAVTAITVWSNMSDKAERETKKLNTELKRARDFFSEIASNRVDEFVESTEGVEQRIDAIDQALNSLFLRDAGLKSLPVPMQQLNTAASDATNTMQNQMQPSVGAINNVLEDSSGIQTQISKEARTILINKRAELEAQIAIDKALGDILAKENKITDELRERFSIRFKMRQQQRAIQDLGVGADEFDSSVRAAGQETRTAAEQEEKRLAEFLNISEEQARKRFQIEKNLQNSIVGEKKKSEKAKTQIQKQQQRARIALASQAASAAGNILSAAFGQTKAVRVATTLMDTYAAAQSAYASQIIPGDPSSLVRAKIAAGLAVASGLARVAQIRSIDQDGKGGGQSSAAAGSLSQGFSTTDIAQSSGRSDRPSPTGNEIQNSNQGDTYVILDGEFDDRMVSVKAKRGDKKRRDKAIKVS